MELEFILFMAFMGSIILPLYFLEEKKKRFSREKALETRIAELEGKK